MIRDLSQTLSVLLSNPQPAGLPPLPAELGNALISFERPSDTFNPTQSTVNLFLFDIRENTELRANEPTMVRNHVATKISQPPRRIACTYLVTAWPVGGTDVALQEHRLLTQVLQILLYHPIIDPTYGQGSLKNLEPAVPVEVALPDAAIQRSEFWSSIGNKLRASLVVQATLALPVFADRTELLAITSKVVMGPMHSGGATGSSETAYQIAGRVTTTTGDPVVDAVVTLVEARLRTKTDIDGVYRFGPLAQGTYTIQAIAGAAQTQILCTVPAPKDKNYDLQIS
jgi:hypothetical protein